MERLIFGILRYQLKLIISAVSVLFEAHEVLLCKRKIGVLNIFMLVTDSGAPRVREARAWAEPHSLINLSIPENLVIT